MGVIPTRDCRESAMVGVCSNHVRARFMTSRAGMGVGKRVPRTEGACTFVSASCPYVGRGRLKVNRAAMDKHESLRGPGNVFVVRRLRHITLRHYAATHRTVHLVKSLVGRCNCNSDNRYLAVTSPSRM